MKTNLIIVEGLPGSGKSTTAAMIAEELVKKGKHVICIDEGVQEHPADYADYDFPDFKTERKKILDKWRAFIEVYDKDSIYVFNCVYLQNPMCETMMRFDMNEEESKGYIMEITEIIKPLNPIIIYINQPDAKAAIDRVLDERGENWLNAVINYHVSQGYGKRNNLYGYSGYIKCLEERKNRELNILQGLGIDYYTISQDMRAEELADLFSSVGWDCPAKEQMMLAIENSTKSFIVRHNGKAAAAINLLGDYGMHWFIKEFIVHKEFQGQMIGIILYRFSENFIKSTMQAGRKIRIDLRASEGTEKFYCKLGSQTMTKNETGSGMEKCLSSCSQRLSKQMNSESLP